MGEEVIERLKVKEKGRINNQDEFLLVCDTFRTQYDNRNEANRRLQEIIDNCCYPERERLESVMPKEFQELQKQQKSSRNSRANQRRCFDFFVHRPFIFDICPGPGATVSHRHF